MDEKKPPSSTTDQELTERVDVLEQQMQDVGVYLANLDQRVTALEGASIDNTLPPVPNLPDNTLPPVPNLPDNTLPPEPPDRPDNTLPPVEPGPEPPEPEPGGEGLSVSLSGSVAETFSDADATDLGNYVGAFVQQRCLRVNHGPWTVYFRPDVDGSRDEIVVEYGCQFVFEGKLCTVADGSTPEHLMQPYTATIRRGDEVLATVEVPHHYWAARWRWQSAPRPFVRDLAALVEMRALPPMSAEAMWGYTPTLPRREYDGPMGTGGLQVAMGVSGDRHELGHITEYQAAWLVVQDANAEISMRTQAEAAGTMCLHVRDTVTGAPVDIQTHPYHSQVLGAVSIPLAERRTAADPGYFTTQSAHMPDAVTIPWLMTDDPYLLEEAQFLANYHCQESNYHQNMNKLPGMVQPSETRGWAWGIRDVARMAVFAPENPPAWLLPRASFKANLDDCLEFVGLYLASQTPSCATFSCITQGNVISSWMIGYHATVAGWMKWSGLLPEWDAANSYILRVPLELNAPPEHGGWDRRWPAPYQINVLGLRETTPEKASPLNSDPQYKASPKDATTPTTWRECWELYQVWCNAQTHTIPLNPADWTEDRVYQNAGDYPYHSNVAAPSGAYYVEIQRACLACASLAGEPGGTAAHAWLAPQMETIFSTYGTPPCYRFTHWPDGL